MIGTYFDDGLLMIGADFDDEGHLRIGWLVMEVLV